MLVARCIQKVRNENGTIKAYILQDMYGNMMPVDGKQIKAAIRSGRAEITNLQIDSAGRLVDKQEVKTNNNKKHEEADILINFLEDVGSCGDEASLHCDIIGYLNNDVINRYRQLMVKKGLCTSLELVQLYAYYCEGKLKEFQFIYYDCYTYHHKYDLIMGMGCSGEEVEADIKYEFAECAKAEKEVEKIIKRYEKQWGLKLNYTNDEGTLFVEGIKFI